MEFALFSTFFHHITFRLRATNIFYGFGLSEFRTNLRLEWRIQLFLHFFGFDDWLRFFFSHNSEVKMEAIVVKILPFLVIFDW